jgi:hypothetical protein
MPNIIINFEDMRGKTRYLHYENLEVKANANP